MSYSDIEFGCYTPSPNSLQSPTQSKTAGRSRAPKGSTNIEKNPEQVKRRNARERRRVQAVNSAFLKLSDHVPIGGRSKKISKVDTLRRASEYILHLQQILNESGGSAGPIKAETLDQSFPGVPLPPHDPSGHHYSAPTPPAMLQGVFEHPKMAQFQNGPADKFTDRQPDFYVPISGIPATFCHDSAYYSFQDSPALR